MKQSADLLGADGPFADSLPGFAPRETQIRMALAVEEALAQKKSMVIDPRHLSRIEDSHCVAPGPFRLAIWSSHSLRSRRSRRTRHSVAR